MTLRQDWKRVSKAFLKLKNDHWNSALFLFARVEDMRKADNKGIDFAIRRLKASDEYSRRVRLYGAPTGHFPRFPLRCRDRMMNISGIEKHYALIGLPEFNYTPKQTKNGEQDG